jgi:RHS repeat-associated protein
LERVFLWDGTQLLAEFDSTGANVIGEYVSTGTDVPFAFLSDGGSGITAASYHMRDAVGNAFALVRSDSNGTQAVREQYAYDEYGVPTTTTDSGYANRLLWKGMFYEGDSTRLYYARARWYDPQQGRFMSEDPAGISGGINQYAFAGGDHVNGADPTGMECDDDVEGDPCGLDESSGGGGGGGDGGDGVPDIPTETAADIAAQFPQTTDMAPTDVYMPSEIPDVSFMNVDGPPVDKQQACHTLGVMTAWTAGAGVVVGGIGTVVTVVPTGVGQVVGPVALGVGLGLTVAGAVGGIMYAGYCQ